MEPAFWHERWRDGRIGFHQPVVTPQLERHWDTLALPAGSTVFVPLCGKSLDMPWLATRGHRVLGVELSETAVRGFFEEQGLVPAQRETGYGVHHAAGPFEIIVGDAFALDHAVLAGCAGVFDRAALIALPPNLRRRYVETTWASLPDDCRGLLVTLEYPQAEMAGPPFSVEAAEVQALFAAAWSPTLVERSDILAQEPRFAAAGVGSLATAAWRLQRQASV
ncbi:thiopurine S-methyltransferase [Luteimonas terricola]|uniref:Thiopurine S-methyltransferase n=1 Tax=Luteimonas terricola TaxID=645597 RepID=A0ABQ2EH96_9GAMM|nr:thiopurine S-methyltransferase [Luteimonas terricola]GGK06984.1 thiopurine S-methyltransferase [Luteimonas terricola]